ncbi:MAG: hypothetical protein GF355_08400 [Candidatus Eisenbacteria bacterium]|nr:hypothetical protein [Candidatus Eisenbacteria bacterium]
MADLEVYDNRYIDADGMVSIPVEPLTEGAVRRLTAAHSSRRLDVR